MGVPIWPMACEGKDSCGNQWDQPLTEAARSPVHCPRCGKTRRVPKRAWGEARRPARFSVSPARQRPSGRVDRAPALLPEPEEPDGQAGAELELWQRAAESVVSLLGGGQQAAGQVLAGVVIEPGRPGSDVAVAAPGRRREPPAPRRGRAANRVRVPDGPGSPANRVRGPVCGGCRADPGGRPLGPGRPGSWSCPRRRSASWGCRTGLMCAVIMSAWCRGRRSSRRVPGRRAGGSWRRRCRLRRRPTGARCAAARMTRGCRVCAVAARRCSGPSADLLQQALRLVCLLRGLPRTRCLPCPAFTGRSWRRADTEPPDAGGWWVGLDGGRGLCRPGVAGPVRALPRYQRVVVPGVAGLGALVGGLRPWTGPGRGSRWRPAGMACTRSARSGTCRGRSTCRPWGR
jgi:hypothetical protein